ncbi:ATP-binding protein [Pedobacter sp. BS3]|uniref:ATP-binding protein n=1 Tax=Pedobacter sp. BS3 TaxID=2567937 RepID=UPI0011EC03B4|nr:ATP-binding protein [Pedobacter sp. BS3]TZF83077.1 ATP-binding protein [Pedobacter sp. BS3]
MIKRTLEASLTERLNDEKAIIILGARQVGKSTLVNDFRDKMASPVMYWTGDDADIRQMLKEPTSARLKQLIGKAATLIIDEAQRIENIGVCIKLIIDNIKNIKVIATGSSSFDLANRINEPLTGRKWEYRLYPLSFSEMVNHHGLLEERRMLNHRLVYGYYPEIVNNPGDEMPRLRQLADSYLYKDILTWERLLKPEKLERLIQALAYQLGSEVSYNELGQLCGLDNQTVEKYIQLLEKAYIIYRLPSFNRNLRNELKKSRKIYFYDNGIRNAVINQFSAIETRQDTGVLWENFIMNERLKYIDYHAVYCNRYFWRTHAQQEIDYVEDRNGKLYAYEFKWNAGAKTKFPGSFMSAYQPAEALVITPDNFVDFVSNGG